MQILNARLVTITAVVSIAAAMGLLSAPSFAQPPDSSLPRISDLLGEGGVAAGGENAEPAEVRLIAAEKKAGAIVTLAVTVKVPPGSYTYSTNPSFGGATRLAVRELKGLEPFDDRLHADRAPKKAFDDILEQEVEKYYDDVTFSRKYVVRPGTTPDEAVIAGEVHFQVCNDRSCTPHKVKFDLALAEAVRPEKSETNTGGSKPERSARSADGSAAAEAVFELTTIPHRKGFEKSEPVTARFALSPKNAGPGEEVTLSVTIEPEDEWHVFALTQDPANAGLPTRILVRNSYRLEPIGEEFSPSRPPKTELTFEKQEQKVHYGEITWKRRFKVAAAAEAGEYGVEGAVRYQACREGTCRLPMTVPFVLGRTGGASSAAGDRGSVENNDASAAESDRGAPSGATPRLDLNNLEAKSPAGADVPLPLVLLTAFAAGFILNFMPCVLPVIGLKLMAFVQQAGDSRGRILALNVWFSAGLMLVFLILATLAVVLGMGWGQQFSSVTFNVILTSVVFVFALSFLGVWEIPIPGFAASGKAHELMDREGASGAFSKGVLTTILATPCSGPMLGPALTWAVSQPPIITYTGFAAVGLGMASPYLLIGAFPQFIRFLPKPGAWMDTLKHILGFVLLGTVVFLLSFIAIPYVVPTVAFLIGLGAACWWIGRTPLTEPLDKRLRAWLGASAFAVLMSFVSFGWLHGVMESRFERAVDRQLAARMQGAETADDLETAAARNGKANDEGNELPWRPYSQRLLERLVQQRKTVFIDFTADW